jgi:hypothetical protein
MKKAIIPAISNAETPAAATPGRTNEDRTVQRLITTIDGVITSKVYENVQTDIAFLKVFGVNKKMLNYVYFFFTCQLSSIITIVVTVVQQSISYKSTVLWV